MQDFSTPSLPPNTEKDEAKANDHLREYQIVQRRQWEQRFVCKDIIVYDREYF